MDGIAQVAATLMAELPELDGLSDSQIALLAGLALHPYDSGQRHLQGGRKKARRVLYMAVERCISINAVLKACSNATSPLKSPSTPSSTNCSACTTT